MGGNISRDGTKDVDEGWDNICGTMRGSIGSPGEGIAVVLKGLSG